MRTTACPQYEDNACCLPSTVQSAGKILDAYGADYHWDRCATYPNAEVQTVTVVATGGTWKMSFRGEDTTAIAASATAAKVQAALVALSTIDADGLLVASVPSSGVYTVTFIGMSSGVDGDADLLGVTNIDLTGVTSGPTAAETTKGIAGSPYKMADGVTPYAKPAIKNAMKQFNVAKDLDRTNEKRPPKKH